MRWILTWMGVGGAFGILDALWLTQMFERLYKPALGPLLAPGLRLDAAFAFYLMYVTGLVLLAVRPTVLAGGGPKAAALRGASLGAFAYATYDLTNQATLAVWPVHVSVIDIAWGTFASATASAAGALAWSRTAPRGA
ncbi:MAG: DUF2177 family protein [Phenylobacterium sp.]|jgi:uncharacterized membrane protein|uniref:DUF2177 family protein n=1 Tax=Phenylobacterium sp. TaxID=1871053 RepID=UPI0025DD4086|nr:DUF2177 family protein [Phenylobacterium sp.]MCA3709680.1 DUF2177 family protein [Phenylobacterium sp.]MCA3712123.1 DUF2177 family protein [Phenylobacterium sp.]MCA3716321.1 DUF2177 family protein [Phenylobacterium sp.]MCA3724930.1 DUF2177 family protein [Phenylobacterium sp.]MCA3725264.1 DUF2177 family protein [Phenylobacterium sp.]